MATLLSTTHHWNLASDQIEYTLAFSDGKVFTDKVLRGSERHILANHLQQWVDALRVMDAPIPDEPAEVE